MIPFVVVKNGKNVDNIKTFEKKAFKRVITYRKMGNLAYIWKQNYSNRASLEGRNKPWWIAIVLFIVGVFLPWIPCMTSGYLEDSSEFVTASQNYEVDKGLMQFLSQDYLEEIEFDRYDNGDVKFNFDIEGLDSYSTTEGTYDDEYSNLNEQLLFKTTYSDTAVGACAYVTTNETYTGLSATYYYDCLGTSNTDLIDQSANYEATEDVEESDIDVRLQVYFLLIDDMIESESNDDIEQFINNFIYSEILDLNSGGTAYGNYPHSYLILTPQNIYMALYPVVNSTTTSSALDTYSGTTYSAFNNIVYDNDGNQLYANLKEYLYRDENATVSTAYTNTLSMLNQGARAYNIYNTWINVLIETICSVASTLVAIVVVFILAKRKRSSYRDMKFTGAIKIGLALPFSSNLIAMIVGFFSLSFSFAIVPLCILIRLFFMNSKICPPPEQNEKPLYQARS